MKKECTATSSVPLFSKEGGRWPHPSENPEYNTFKNTIIIILVNQVLYRQGKAGVPRELDRCKFFYPPPARARVEGTGNGSDSGTVNIHIHHDH